MDKLIEGLNAPDKNARLGALAQIKQRLDRNEIDAPARQVFTNNHVHTKYSFSPYSPAKAVWMAYLSGLSTAGLIDHDAILGAEEFISAGEILGIATTIGFEMRTDWTQTPLYGKRLNNPDQLSSGYICAHGLPHSQIGKADAFLIKVRKSRNQRNRAMVWNLNKIMAPHGITLDYDSDVLPISYAAFGGTVTDRHLLFAAANKIIDQFGAGKPLADFVSGPLGISLSAAQRGYLEAPYSENYAYDLLNILKSSFVARMYIDAGPDETPPVTQAVAFIKEMGAIPTYCYLGDVEASPTGDKKQQKFEDDYLEDVFTTCRDIGFEAMAYMPSRNTQQQLSRVMTLCDKYGYLQISGEDINQPRQSFVCRQLQDYPHLIDTTWALVGHELAATKDVSNGIFAGVDHDPEKIQQQIEKYKKIGFENFSSHK